MKFVTVFKVSANNNELYFTSGAQADVFSLSCDHPKIDAIQVLEEAGKYYLTSNLVGYSSSVPGKPGVFIYKDTSYDTQYGDSMDGYYYLKTNQLEMLSSSSLASFDPKNESVKMAYLTDNEKLYQITCKIDVMPTTAACAAIDEKINKEAMRIHNHKNTLLAELQKKQQRLAELETEARQLNEFNFRKK